MFACLPSCPAQSAGPALVRVKAAAAAGDPAAEDKLAGEFARKSEFVQAELWYRKAARQGCVHAQGRLGELLLAHAGLSAQLKPGVKAAIDKEAITWLTLAGHGGDTRARADLANAYFAGTSVKADLLEAYKWGDLAAQAPLSTPGSSAGRSIRDAATLKMTFDQIAEAKRRVATFGQPVSFERGAPDPSWVSQIKLSGISGPTNSRLAIINNQTFGVGDVNFLKISGKTVQVRCLEIREKSVVVHIDGINHPAELRMADNSPDR